MWRLCSLDAPLALRSTVIARALKGRSACDSTVRIAVSSSIEGLAIRNSRELQNALGHITPGLQHGSYWQSRRELTGNDHPEFRCASTFGPD